MLRNLKTSTQVNKLVNLGGVDSIPKHIGKDVTKVYDAIESHNTNTASKDLNEFCIGTIKTDRVTSKPIQKEQDYNYDVDIKRGILYQVWTKMNREQYLAFIHDPKHMISPPEAILFENAFCERFTKTPWFIIPLIWVPVILYYLHLSFSTVNIPLIAFPFFYLLGIFVWTFIEYVLHRFVFHLDEKLPDNRWALMFHFLFHGIHHAFPMDRNRLVFPPVAAFPIFLLLKVIISAFFGKLYTVVIAGVLTGYIIYDLTHYFIHHTKPNNSYYKFLKQYHILHHYKSPDQGFGVSNNIWDHVFNTVLKMNK
jgi:4-hydroxysphinganine ceramide fatty acyl 2-hydroxylase